MSENSWDRELSPGMRRLQNRKDYRQTPDGGGATDNFYQPPPEDFDTEEMRGSMQYILAKQIGQYVVVEFLVGTQEIVRKQGMLYYVGRSFVTLYEEACDHFIVCDVYSIKFVYFFMPGDRPNTNYNALPASGGNGMGAGNSRRPR